MNVRLADGLPAEMPPEVYTREQARQALQLGRTSFWRLEKDRKIIVRRQGAKMVVLRSDLMAYLAALPEEAPKTRAA